MKWLSLALATAITGSAFADDTDDVIDRIRAYWDARNKMDYATQHEMRSEKGVLSANSDGSFFSSTSSSATLDDTKESLSSLTESEVEVRYPEAYEIAEGAVLARYYLEGNLVFDDGSRADEYRVRATEVWVRENGAWKARSVHYSPLHAGHVYKD